MATVRVSKGSPKGLPAPSDRTPFVLGSRPNTIRAPSIKPGPADTRNYTKGNVPNPAGAGPGNTGILR